MIRINLLPAREAKRRIVLRRQLQLTALLLGCAFVLVFMVARSQGKVKEARGAELARIDREIASLNHIIKEVDAFKAKRDLLQKQIEVVHGLKQGQARPAPLLDELSRSLPEKVWLDQVQERGNGLQITGKSLNGNVGIAAFMENMGHSPWFGTAELVESKSEMFRDRRVVSFTVTVPITVPKSKGATT
jgi:type IV pilus assembly protein PilN